MDIDDEMQEDALEPLLDPLNVTIGGNIRMERKRRNMTLKGLSAQLEIETGYLGLIERGRRRPALALLIRISVLFGCSIDDLVLPEERVEKESRAISGCIRLADPRNDGLRNAQEAVISLVSSLTKDELFFIANCMRELPFLRRR